MIIMEDAAQIQGSVLIVDDEIDILEVLKEALSSEGYYCDTATNGTLALKLLDNQLYDILITDIIMTGIDGLELTHKAKQINPDVCVLIITGYIDNISYDKAIEAGATDFIKKPFTATEVIIRLKHIKMQQKLRAMAITDELTGLYNRRGFISLAEQQIKLARRFTKKVIMINIVLDNIEEINNKFGLKEGDAGLVDTANLIKMTFRDTDIIARIMGTRFTVIPIEYDDNNLNGITTALKQNIDKFNNSENRKYNLLISSKLSYCDPDSVLSTEELLADSDKSI
jgi:diguanylate cyclase (GGDEF)-like protein